MATETDPATQLADYFGWVERELRGAGLEAAVNRRSPRYRHLALAAAALLVVGGTVAALALHRVPAKSVRPAATSTPTSTVASAPGRVGGEWQRTAGPPITNRFQHLSITTENGWFVWGGYSALSAEPSGAAMDDGAFYDATTGQWTVLPPAPFDMSDPGGTYVGRGVWTGQEVVITQGGATPLVAAFDPASFTWRTIPIPKDIVSTWPHEGGSYDPGWQTMIGDTMAVMFGKGSGVSLPASMLLLDPATGNWTQTTVPPTLAPFHLVASSTQLFVVESGDVDTTTGCLGATQLHTYDLASDSWTETQLPNGNWQPALAVWEGDRLLLAGGFQCGSSQPVRAAALFDPTTDTWSEIASLPLDGEGVATPAAVTDTMVVAITHRGRPLAYDPKLDSWWYGPSLLPAGSTSVDDRITLVVIGDRMAVMSPGWNVSAMCCDSTGEVFTMPLPTPADFGAPALPLTTLPTLPPHPIPIGACGYLVQTGDSIASIAEQFGITVEELMAANPEATMLIPDDVIAIPISPCPAGTNEQMTAPTSAPPSG